ncbi:MAG: TonB-dependent receptor domain-containing protein, partial [Casimicrobium sp.]
TLPTTGTQAYTRANLLSFQNDCDLIPGMAQYESVLNDFAAARFGCTFDTGSTAILQQPNERTNIVARGTMKINNQLNAFVEAVGSRSVAKKRFEPQQLTTTGGLANAWYPVDGPYYQDLSAYIPSFDRTKPIAYRWRCIPCGPREIETTSDSYRFLAGLDGSFLGKWDYKLGVSTAKSKADSVLGDGYLYTDQLIAALASGKINPWLLPGQSQTPEALALLEAAKARGERLFGGQTTLFQFDGTVSGEIMKLPAGPLSVAAGFDFRQESYVFTDGSTTTRPIFSAPFDASFKKVKRDVTAVYAEALIPIVRNLETTLAVRHDEYSDFGGTTNPKISFRWNPVKAFLARGSYNTGFRAPSFFQSLGAQGEAPIPGNIADPVLCPQSATKDPAVCAIRPLARQGGNPNLKPETSKQWTIGVAFQPTNWFSGSVDLWEVKREDRIYELTPQQVVANFATFPENLVRGTDGRLDGPGGYIQAGFVNADGDITRGTDISLQATGKMLSGKWDAALDGTYVESFRSRVFTSEPYTEFAGQWSSRDLFPRWKHRARFTYTQGPWATTISQSYTRGYKDEVPPNPPPGFNPDVKAYITYGLSIAYTGFKNTQITFGVKNLLDTDPPFTAHNYDFAAGAGWDPRVADPRGRAYTLNLTHKFR